MSHTAAGLIDVLHQHRSARQAERAGRFFKTGKGQYGEHEMFIGVAMPQLRQLAKTCTALPLSEVEILLKSKFHEARLLSLLILVNQYSSGDDKKKSVVARCYLRNTKYVNNWDLVDCSAHLILGPWLENRDTGQLDKLAVSKSLWDRRIAIISTFHFIRQGKFDDTLRIATLLINDPEDLIHKATGWMLREVGNRDRTIEENFLSIHYQTMPRTMLRYAIEKFPDTRRQQYLEGMI